VLLVRRSATDDYKAGYEGHYECPLTILLYYFFKEEARQDD
jgi:hypothetical protein